MARLLKPQFSSSFCHPYPLAPVRRVKTCPNHSSSSGGHSHTTCKCADCLLAIKWSVKAIYIYAITIWLTSLMDQVQQRSIRSIPTHSTGSSIFTSPKEMGNYKFWEARCLQREGAMLQQCLALVVLAPVELTAALSPVDHSRQWRIQFRENSGKLLFLITGQEFSPTSFTLF